MLLEEEFRECANLDVSPHWRVPITRVRWIRSRCDRGRPNISTIWWLQPPVWRPQILLVIYKPAKLLIYWPLNRFSPDCVDFVHTFNACKELYINPHPNPLICIHQGGLRGGVGKLQTCRPLGESLFLSWGCVWKYSKNDIKSYATMVIFVVLERLSRLSEFRIKLLEAVTWVFV